MTSISQILFSKRKSRMISNGLRILNWIVGENKEFMRKLRTRDNLVLL